MTQFDFIVVGSGAAGAASAWRLSSKGYKVACLERGPWLDPSKYPTNYIDWEMRKRVVSNSIISERKNAFDYPVNDTESPIAICNYNAVGGSTILYSGHFPRFRPQDFRLASQDGLARDWPLSYADLKPYFEINEYEMSVSGLAGDPYYPDVKNLLPPVPLGRVGEKLARAFNKKKWHWWPSYSAISTRAQRGRSACINLGPCNTGCPQGAKSSTDITYIPRAQKHGLHLITEAAVANIIVEKSRAVGVRYHDAGNRQHTIFGKNIILAASAIGTPRILLNSATNEFPKGLANSSGLVGKNLMVHPLGYVEGIFSEQLDTDVGPQGCLLYSLEHYRTQGTNHKLGYTMHALRGTGPVEAALSAFSKRKLKFGTQLYSDFFSFYKKQVAITIICEDLPDVNNQVILDTKNKDRHGISGVKIHYKLDNNTKQLMAHGMTNAREILREAGAISSYAHGPVRNAGWHVMGTTRMGHNPKDSVVNPIGKAHDMEGLYVVDSSCFVTGSCVNPANTIQALSLYLSDKILEHFKNDT